MSNCNSCPSKNSCKSQATCNIKNNPNNNIKKIKAKENNFPSLILHYK